MPTVLLINPPSLPGTTANREGTAGMGVVVPHPDGFYYPPQTLAAGVAVLTAAGYRAHALDAVGQPTDSDTLIRHIMALAPDVIGVLVSPKTWAADQAFLEKLRAQTLPAQVVLIGTGARFIPHREWTPLADGVLVGEVEWALASVIDALGHGRPTAGLWRPEEPSPPSPVWVPAGAPIPYPAWDALPVDRYPFLTLWGSRGCSLGCRWCPYAVGWGRVRRARKPERVADELRWLASKFGKHRHIFRDPTFAADPEWVNAFCDALLAKGPPPPWEFEDRPEHLTLPLLQRMKEAGVTQVKLGVEVLSPHALVMWGRLERASQFVAYRTHAAEAIHACRELGILCRVFILTGIGEREEDLARTEEFLRQTKPHYVSVKRLSVYPGVEGVEDYTPLPDEILSRWEARLSATAHPPRRRPWRRWVQRVWR